MNQNDMKFAVPVAELGHLATVDAFARAKVIGFEGVEVVVGMESAERLSEIVREVGLAVCCVACDMTYTGAKDDADDRAADHVRAAIDTASRVGASLVRLPDARVGGRVPLSSLTTAFGRWLAPLAELALTGHVKLAVQNANTFRHATDLWKLMDQFNPRSLGVCYDVLDAALVGETPAVGVSVLNSRIALVRVRDATFLAGQPARRSALGAGAARVESIIKRLRGIGFGGWVSYQPVPRPDGLDTGEINDALKTLHTWRTKLGVSEREFPFQKKPVPVVKPVVRA